MRFKLHFILLASLFFAACQNGWRTTAQQLTPRVDKQTNNAPAIELSPEVKKMLESANEQTKITKSYDPNYTVLPYPNGDVPMEKGVCTDVVIRAMRAAGIDLQREVHEDMTANFAAYPRKWNLKAADSNIDHRRVPNLQTFFTRRKKSITVTDNANDYQPGDIVTWDLDGKGMTHIGIVSADYSPTTKRFLIIHNIGRGAQSEDVLFDWKITGHYRFFGSN